MENIWENVSIDVHPDFLIRFLAILEKIRKDKSDGIMKIRHYWHTEKA